MKTMLALLSLVFAAGGPPHSSAPAPQPFSVVLDYTPSGWSAQCELGCEIAWKAGFACREACDAIVDARGIITVANTRELEKFAFAVTRTTDGVRASARNGAVWTTLSWGCASQPCRARVTESGVTVLRDAR